jgi:UDP-glucuronate 4-epimerase
MRILVTGAAGFIGSHLCQALIERGHTVIGVDAFDGFLYGADRKRRNVSALREAIGDGAFSLVEADVCDGDAMVQSCVDAEVVCHLAALAGVRPSLREPQRYVRANLHGTVSVLEACRATGVTRVVFASSSSVYGARGDGADLAAVQAFRESDPCVRPASVYGATKRAGELLCSTYRDLYGIGVSALRYFTVYGPRQRPDMAIHRFFRAAARGERVALFGDGSSRRDYTFIDDIVAGTVAACERVQPDTYQVYNLGGTRTTALADLVEGIGRTVGRDIVIERAPDQPGDVPVTYADIERARHDLDYQPVTDLATGLARFWAWFQVDGS